MVDSPVVDVNREGGVRLPPEIVVGVLDGRIRPELEIKHTGLLDLSLDIVLMWS